MKTSTTLMLLLVALCGCTVHASLRGTAGQRHKALAYRTLQKALAEGNSPEEAPQRRLGLPNLWEHLVSWLSPKASGWICNWDHDCQGDLECRATTIQKRCMPSQKTLKGGQYVTMQGKPCKGNGSLIPTEDCFILYANKGQTPPFWDAAPRKLSTVARKLMMPLDYLVGRQYAKDMSHIGCNTSKEKYETCYPPDAACTCVMWTKGPLERTKPCPCTKENERTRKYKAWKDTDAGKEEAKKAAAKKAEDRVMSTKSWSEAQKKKWNAYAKEVEAHCPRNVDC